ncbi:hypothetical protein H4219_003481 [Mycoemilia scoparia]|uniref:Chitin synthase n=1 Tax=Mycoemilia scoparia TaxID=417184 RepID=A0A9W7ZYN7_9FUNG|nr:hypothetical protein H4219_003481 [Mycoemilia scoparia]
MDTDGSRGASSVSREFLKPPQQRRHTDSASGSFSSGTDTDTNISGHSLGTSNARRKYKNPPASAVSRIDPTTFNHTTLAKAKAARTYNSRPKLTQLEEALLHRTYRSTHGLGASRGNPMSDNGSWDLFDSSALQIEPPTSPSSPTSGVQTPEPGASSSKQDGAHSRLHGKVFDRYSGAISSSSKRIANIVSPRKHAATITESGGHGVPQTVKSPEQTSFISNSAGLENYSTSAMKHQQSSSFSTRATATSSSLFRVRSQSLPNVSDGQSNDTYEMKDLLSPESKKSHTQDSQSTAVVFQNSSNGWRKFAPIGLWRDKPRGRSSSSPQTPSSPPGRKRWWKDIPKRTWVAVMNFVFPGGVNRFGNRDKSATGLATEVIFMIVFMLATVIFTLWASLVPKALCSTNYTFTPDDIWNRRFVSANGIVSDFHLSHSTLSREMDQYLGYDVSTLFPRYQGLMDSNMDPVLKSAADKCDLNMTAASDWAKAWVVDNPSYTAVDDELVLCPLPQDPKRSKALCLDQHWKSFLNNQVGWVQMNSESIKKEHGHITSGWVILHDSVYDVSEYLQHATTPIIINGTVTADYKVRNDTMFLPYWLTTMLMRGVGTDITDEFDKEVNDKMGCEYVLEGLFYRGTTQKSRTAFACANTNIVAWLTFGLYFLSVFICIFSSECYVWNRKRKMRKLVKEGEQDTEHSQTTLDNAEKDPLDDITTEPAADTESQPICAVVIPCFNEAHDDLSSTIRSVAYSSYPDQKTLIVIISDGIPQTHQSLLQITANPGLCEEAKMYGCCGNGPAGTSTSYSFAKVYSGFYEYSCNRVPYIIIAKEAFQGRTDSIMLFLNFVRVFGSLETNGSSQNSDKGLYVTEDHQRHVFLDEELESHLIELQCKPKDIELLLFMEPTMQIEREAIQRFVARMSSNPKLISVSGTLLALNPRRSILRFIQNYTTYLEHYIQPAWCAFTGTLPILHQSFTMYRVKDREHNYIGDPRLVSELNSLLPRTLHNKHIQCSGGDGYIIQKIGKLFGPRAWGFEPTSRAGIMYPIGQLHDFDSRARQRFKTEMHIAIESFSIYHIWRWGMILLVLHIAFPFFSPAASVMLYLELVIACFHNTPAIVVTEIIAAIVGSMVVLFLLLRRWSTPLYMFIYAVLGIPIYFIWTPLSSFLTMNRVWVPPDQLKASNEAASKLAEAFVKHHARHGSSTSDIDDNQYSIADGHSKSNHVLTKSLDSISNYSYVDGKPSEPFNPSGNASRGFQQQQQWKGSAIDASVNFVGEQYDPPSTSSHRFISTSRYFG